MKKWIFILICLITSSGCTSITTPKYFDGQGKLTKAIKSTDGGFYRHVAVWESVNYSPAYRKHAEHMYNIIHASGIPRENIDLVDCVRSIEILSGYRVVNSSTTWNGYPSAVQIWWIEKNNTLFVCSTGNTGQYGRVRNMYKPESQVHASVAEVPWNYEKVMQLLNTNKVVLATIVLKDKDGKFYRYENAIRAGDAKHYTFAIPMDLKTAKKIGTSGAAARLSAFVFHLSQFWNTPEEIIDVLRKTATDIGEKGPDEEFGWGVPNTNHPIILNKIKDVKEKPRVAISTQQ